LVDLAYALLLAEAREADIRVTGADVDAFFSQIGQTGQAYDHLMAEFRALPQHWTEGMVRQAVRNWLMICKSFAEANVTCPPSATEVQVMYRDVREEIDLRVLRLEAGDYLKDAKDPNQADIDAHFNMYRTVFAGKSRQVTSMGFGYRQPARARLQYLFVRGDAVRRVTEPPFDVVADYFNKHPEEFVKEVPDPSAPTQPAGTTQPATRPTIKRPMTFAEAKPQIIEKLHDQAVRAKLDEAVVQVEGVVRRLLAGNVDPGQVYAEARKQMTTPADSALATVLGEVKIENRRLDEAVGVLASAAKLQGICFPWGTHGKQTLMPSVKVTIKGTGLTLAAALEEITKQVKWPKLRWAFCDGFRGVLFSVAPAEGEGVDFFPLRVGETALSTAEELAEDPVLSTSFVNPRGGSTLVRTAFSARGLSADPRETPMAKVGQSGPRMYVMGDTPGRLIWRLVEAVAAHVPEKLTDRPGLRQQVVDDLKLQNAFKKAEKDATKLKNAAKTVGVEVVAKALKRETFTTGLFSRLWIDLRRRIVGWTDVRSLDLGTAELQAFVIPKAFELMPKNVEPNAPPGPPAVGIVAMPIKREVLVMERIGFRPVVKSEYESFIGRPIVARFIREQQQEVVLRQWFDMRGISQRVGLAKE
jgi:hypothetical protein